MTQLLPKDNDASASLALLLDKIRKCRICIDAPQANCLPHQPRPVVWGQSTARILVAGQAPGRRVHTSGIPFNDPSGERLRDWMGVNRGTFYDTRHIAIAPMGFCFPGQDAKGHDLPPRKECAPAWRNRLMAQLAHIELVLAIGAYAQHWHLKQMHHKNLTETVKAWRTYMSGAFNPPVLPLPHPSWRNNAWLKRNPWFETEVLVVLRREVHCILGSARF